MTPSRVSTDLILAAMIGSELARIETQIRALEQQAFRLRAWRDRYDRDAMARERRKVKRQRVCRGVAV